MEPPPAESRADSTAVRRERDAFLIARAVDFIPPSSRDEFLADACAGDDELRQAVTRILRASADQGPSSALPASAFSWLVGSAGAQLPVEREPGELTPATFAGYRILRPIGSGASGAVFAAERDGQIVALKLLRATASEEAAGRRFRRESTILRTLDHPGIARFFDSGEVSGMHGPERYIAVEYVEGRPLTVFARERGLPIGERLRLVADVCLAVAHAHQRDVVHRDLKPDNLLVTPDGAVKVIDFGIATADVARFGSIGRTTSDGFAGTLDYAAPEQLDGERADRRVDIYALGAILFELLTGRTPHELRGLGLLDAAERLRNRDATRLGSVAPSVDPDLCAIVDKALARDPDDRYTTIPELHEDLLRRIAGRPVFARSPGLGELLLRAARRRLGWIVAGAVVTVLMVGLSVWAIQADRRAAERVAFTLDVMTGQLTEATLASEVGVPFTARLRLLDPIEKALDGLAEVQPDDARVQTLLARAADARGDTLAVLGRLAEARASFQKAAQLRQQVADAAPTDPVNLLDLAISIVKLGDLAIRTGDRSETDQRYWRALAVDEDVVRAHPGDVRGLDDLSWSLERTGVRAAESGDLRTAARLWRRRHEVSTKLLQLAPDRGSARRSRVFAEYYLAILAMALEDSAELDRRLEATHQLAHDLAVASPDNVVIQAMTARTQLETVLRKPGEISRATQTELDAAVREVTERAWQHQGERVELETAAGLVARYAELLAREHPDQTALLQTAVDLGRRALSLPGGTLDFDAGLAHIEGLLAINELRCRRVAHARELRDGALARLAQRPNDDGLGAFMSAKVLRMVALPDEPPPERAALAAGGLRRAFLAQRVKGVEMLALWSDLAADAMDPVQARDAAAAVVERIPDEPSPLRDRMTRRLAEH